MNCAVVMLLCYFLNVIVIIKAANILGVFPTPSISHQVVFRPLTVALARRGHNVTVITPNPIVPKSEVPTNFTEIDVHDISYSTFYEELKKMSFNRKDVDEAMKINLLLSRVFERQLRSKELQYFIQRNNSLQFDLIFSEACVPSSLIFSHIFKAPVIQISSFGATIPTNAIVGAPFHPLLQPIVVRRKLYNLTLWESICEIYQQFKFQYLHYLYEDEQNLMLKNIFGVSTPSIRELYENINMVFLNVHPIWNDNQPVPPSLIYLGGLQLKPTKELPWDLKRYLDSSIKGVIYVSFGTNVQPSVLPPRQVKMMAKVLSEMPYNVIWKWATELPSNYSNIKVLKWLPQSDLLRHEKLKLFITQGGQQSTDEAISAGVPLIGIPIVADQFYNVQKYVRHGIGKQLDKDTVSEKEFRNAVLTVIEDQSFRNNVVKLKSIMYDQPQSPLDRAIWWTEYVLRHGGAKHLRARAAFMSWAEYYELNLVLIVLGSFIVTFILLCITLSYLLQFVRKIMFKNRKLKMF